MKSKKMIIMTCLILSMVFLVTGTYAYFRKAGRGNVIVNTGDLQLSVNGKDASKNETFTITLTNEDGSKLKPGDSGSFVLNFDATGSSLDVSIFLNILRDNLPDNLKFYTDAEHTDEILIRKKYDIMHSNSMTKDVTIYWYWENLEDSNDNDFMFKEISATIDAEISYYRASSFAELLFEKKLSSDENVDFGLTSSETNGFGLMLRDGTQNDEYPVVYYRGDVTDNNVIFADFCWLIVRTTETGGVKLIYNGEVNDDGSCGNDGYGIILDYDYQVQTGYSVYFNTGGNNGGPVYVGYMYNDRNYYFSGPSTNVLDTVGYKTHLDDETIDGTTGRHTQNLYDSDAKYYIDNWFDYNIVDTPAENLLEDAIWCNDRSIASSVYTPDNYATNGKFYFAPYTRLFEYNYAEPTLFCIRVVDRFTVDRSNGNGDLTYPIGLLTADEAVFAGIIAKTSGSPNVSSYLMYFASWLMSPAGFSIGQNKTPHQMMMNGPVDGWPIGPSSSAMHPTISIGSNATIVGGDGSAERPYQIGAK